MSVVLTPWVLNMQLRTFLLNFAWLEAILKIKKHGEKQSGGLPPN